jgi:hypothetical protein
MEDELTFQSAFDIFLAITTIVITVMYIWQSGCLCVWPLLIVPFALLWIHVVGNYMQEQEIGASLVRGSLHNIGVASCTMTLPLFCVLWLASRRGAMLLRKTAVELYSKLLLVVWALTTLAGIAYEIYTITYDREEAIKMGYSGKIDWWDIAAFALGFVLMCINYLALHPVVMRRACR